MRIAGPSRPRSATAIRRRFVTAALTAGLALLAGAPAALAHAQLVGTQPSAGSTVATEPKAVVFEFNQPVNGTLGAVKVYDAKGNEVDNGDVSHPGGRQSWMGVGLKAGLPNGTYVGTYRVISADTHIVYGGLVFSIGAAGAAPTVSVSQLISKNKTGEITTIAFAVVKGLDYVSLALLLGAMAFLALIWIPSLSAAGGAGAEWADASRAFARRIVALLFFAITLGVASSALGIIFQGAAGAGVSFWSALHSKIISNVLGTRFGWVWGTRALVFAVLGCLLGALVALRRGAVPVLRRAALGAEGLVLDPTPSRWLLFAGAIPAAYLAITPALSGHASIQSPRGLLFPADVVHVVAMSLWLGGLACLLFVLPAATRRLQPADRGRLLAAALIRFSPLALACVVALLVTGVTQGYVEIRSWDGLFHSSYGIAVIIKFGLLMALIALGAINRQRVLPALRRIAAAGQSPGASGVLLRRTLRAEVALLVVVLGVVSALVGYTPPISLSSGPFATNTTIGAAELEMTVDPAKVGLNTIHIYLINAQNGSQFTQTKELDLQASLPSKRIGPLTLTPTVAGPGHYIVSGAQFLPAGTWTLQITDRVSAFDEYTKTINVPIH